MRRSVIKGVGAYLPEKIVSNHDLTSTLETSHEWIFERTGIVQRHVAAENELTSDLAYQAGMRALQMANISVAQLDLVIVATATPDHTFPATATAVQAKLGMERGFAFDISAVCSGFVFALATADMYIQQGFVKTALVIGAETLSRIVDWKDRTTSILFGDGAGAVVLQMEENPQEDRGILGHMLHTDGRGYPYLNVSGGASSSSLVGTIQMNGREVFKQAVSKLGQVAEDILKAHNVSSDELDWLIPHQANVRIIDSVREKLKMAPEKIILTIDCHANTSSASIPLALEQAVTEGKVKPGHLILCEAFAAGFAWGANLIRF